MSAEQCEFRTKYSRGERLQAKGAFVNKYYFEETGNKWSCTKLSGLENKI